MGWKESPLGVKIIGIIGMLLSLFIGLMLPHMCFTEACGSFFDSISLLIYVAMVVVVLLFVFLFIGKNWARICVSIILFALVLLIFYVSLTSIAESNMSVFFFYLISGVITLLAVAYLLFNKGVKEAFKN